MSKQVIVIGAGAGGLSTNILLAASGARVRLIERLPMAEALSCEVLALLDGCRFLERNAARILTPRHNPNPALELHPPGPPPKEHS